MSIEMTCSSAPWQVNSRDDRRWNWLWANSSVVRSKRHLRKRRTQTNVSFVDLSYTKWSKQKKKNNITNVDADQSYRIQCDTTFDSTLMSHLWAKDKWEQSLKPNKTDMTKRHVLSLLHYSLSWFLFISYKNTFINLGRWGQIPAWELNTEPQDQVCESKYIFTVFRWCINTKT